MVVDLDEDGGGESGEGFGVGEDADGSGSPFEFLLDPDIPFLGPRYPRVHPPEYVDSSFKWRARTKCSK